MLHSTCAANAVTASLANTSSEGDGKRIGNSLGEEHFRLGPLTYSSSSTAKTDFLHKPAQGWKFKSRQYDLECQVHECASRWQKLSAAANITVRLRSQEMATALPHSETARGRPN